MNRSSNVSDYKGLTNEQAKESRRVNGENILTPPPREPMWRLFLGKFNDPIIRILLIAALLSLLISIRSGEIYETIGIIFAILLATGISFWFEADAGKKFNLLNKVNEENPVKVIRDGSITEVPKRDIVVGDIVILDAGEEVPADGVLLEAVSLSVNESALTGEPLARKRVNPNELSSEATYPVNQIYKSTTVLEGYCLCRVTSVGDNTEYGKVARRSAEISNEPTPLNRQLEGLARFIGFAGFILAVATFAALFVKDIFLGEAHYGAAPLWTLFTVIAAGFVAIAKVWIPIIMEGVELLRPGVKHPDFSKMSWGVSALIAITLALTSFVIGYLVGYNPLESASWIDGNMALRILKYFMVSVTLIVVAVPEGLPMAVTLSLALSMRKMLTSNNLVRKMHATETMGAATVICTDKTGTLTQNQMRVSFEHFVENPEIIESSIALNSTAHLDRSVEGKIRTLGNPTEAALLIWLSENGKDYLKIRESSKIINQLTFSTERKYMATVALSPESGRYLLFVKGAPEIVASFTADYPADVSAKLAGYQARAMRTLGFGYREISPDRAIEDVESLVKEGGLTYLGVVAISDPLREDVTEAVASCVGAGIEVKMITGDTPGTAREIARRIGILGEDELVSGVISGLDFDSLTDIEAMERLPFIKVMCRARPSDKERMVRLLQRLGEVVAVTGDGTNDAPALNHAHVGLSMGSGTSVAKEASDITLLDDSFSSIVTAVLWGRSLYSNIQRFLIFQLTINVTALVVVLLGSIFGKEIPLTITQMLWVNLIMDTFAAGALASLPPDIRVLKERPRRPGAFIVTPSMRGNILITALLFIAGLLTMLWYLGDVNNEISEYNISLFFTIFVMLQFWNLFNAKAFLTGKSAFKGILASPAFMVVASAIIFGQLLIVEFGGELFRTVPLTFRDWMLVIAGTSVVLWIGETVRFFKRRVL
ncbi:MAG TPA: calcium-translocating P-type ATPase, PMCA-type [Rikenellaceae bacterium]|nr:MAG: calcium-translocating P-type ATPase, PMCA-type [Bacteroidetes bacterium GWE2_40_15]HBZ25224.1 calcium-translocating P-type ATPase, PMCA-type [Rikenellaceae bacterium]